MEDFHCPNPFCKQPNPITADFCQACHTFLPKRYLWMHGQNIDKNIGQGAESLSAGSIINDRYLVLNDNILLDRYPANPPEMPGEISLLLEAYLKLSHFIPHLPKVYSSIILNHKEQILLEDSAIYPYVMPVVAEPEWDDGTQPKIRSGTLMPTLQSEWAIASPFRLLNWVYQITTLWDALNRFNATETLFCMDCIRVDGGLIKLLELRFNSKKKDNHSLPLLLQYLIHCNDQSEGKADLTVMRRFRDMYERLIHEPEEDHSYLLCEWLDQEIIHHNPGSLDITIVTQTDQGPNRNRNEDSCYPTSTQRFTQQQSRSSDREKPLLVVCDGIGGHEGGNIASNLAIETFTKVLRDQISKVPGHHSQVDTAQVIEDGIRVSNDAISNRNDQEGRSDRQRMGTTIVLVRVEGQRVQIAHVGDSRAYRVTTKGCYQITVDDDIASREVRLGYTLYREALQHNGSGALTQALGMVASSLLHPTVRTSFVDEDCIYLLCSDGLSDFDRIDEFWAKELIPVLYGQAKLSDACQNLIELANAHNGHDNVTVGLLHCKVPSDHSIDRSNRSTLRPLWSNKSKNKATQSFGQNSTPTPQTFNSQVSQDRPRSRTHAKTKLLQTRQSRSAQGKWIFLLSFVAGIAIVSLLLALLFNKFNKLQIDSDPLVSSTASPNPANPSGSDGLKVNQLIKVLPPIAPAPTSAPTNVPAGQAPVRNSEAKNSEVKNPESPASLDLLPNPGLPLKGELDIRVGEIKPGSILRVVDRQMVSISSSDPGRNTLVPWVKLQICSTGVIGDSKQAIGDPKPLKPGIEGWHSEPTLLSQIAPTSVPLSPSASKACPVISSTPSPNPTIKSGG